MFSLGLVDFYGASGACKVLPCLQDVMPWCLVCTAPCESLTGLCLGPPRASLYTAYHPVLGARALPHTPHPLFRQVRGSAVQAAHTGAARLRPWTRRCWRVTCPWMASCRAHWTACMSATGRRRTPACQSPATSTGTVHQLQHSCFPCPQASAAPRPALTARLEVHASTAVKHGPVVMTVQAPRSSAWHLCPDARAAMRCRLQ